MTARKRTFAHQSAGCSSGRLLESRNADQASYKQVQGRRSGASEATGVEEGAGGCRGCCTYAGRRCS